jgi:hypothetical protein
MARILFILILLFALTGIFYIYRGEPSKSDTAPSKALSKGVADWNVFTPSSGNFKVFFPTLPQSASSTIVDKVSQEPKYFATYASTTPDGDAFIVNTITFKPDEKLEDAKNLLTKHVMEMVQAREGNKLLSLKEGVYKGEPALDFDIENGEMHILGKAFVKNKKLYVLSMTSQKDKFDSEKFVFFVNSFEPLNP